ncbi:MAG: signal recognition particle-docking protein FtsY [Rhizobiales bacterium]|nr:signal recognition particle-docking protein FtsY [Hyphomicrobiales bacterium]
MVGFLKKVFSFGRKQVVEEAKPEAEEPLVPINWDALKELQRDTAPELPPAVAEVPPAPPEPTPPEQQPLEPAASELPLAEVPPEPEAVAEELPTVTAAAPEPPAPPELLAPEPETVSEPPPAEAEASPEPEPPPQGVSGGAAAEPEPPAPPEPLPLEPEAAPEPPPAEAGASPEPEPPPQDLPAMVATELEPPAQHIVELPAAVEPAHEPPVAIEPVHEQVPDEAPAATALGEPSAKVRQGKVAVAKTVAEKAEPQPVAQPAPRLSWLQRMRAGLARSSRELTGNITGLFTKRKLDEETLQDLEDVLIRADLGVETALRVTDALASGRYGRQVSDEEVRAVMAEEIGKVLAPVAQALELDLSHKPHVILVVGVNGTGKTTTIGKLAAKLTEGGLSVMLAAGDTFRAAAIEQLKIWGERTGAPVVASKLGADAAGLAYDAFVKAKETGSDVLIIDTAGRLQNKAELMAELEKIVRVLGKLDPEAPHTVLQTVDATTGQNALNQVEIFRNVAGVNGLVMTKLDGTARGGILVAIAAKHRLPVYFIGVGEQVDDLEPFSASEFARAIAGVA